MSALHIVALVLIVSPSVCALSEEVETYNAAVVEYNPQHDSSVDSEINILNNVDNYIKIIEVTSNTLPKVDLIVFPEFSLIGYRNQQKYLEVPDPKEETALCTNGSAFEEPLVRLACAARNFNLYVVVNLSEKRFNSSSQATEHFNTNVVFDRKGVVIARYRKIHLFNEGIKQPSPDKQLVYFDTDFGVRFGLLTCFDIIFKDPGVTLAQESDVTHFIFPTAWFSQMPFLTAAQEQYYWSYTQDVVLLAAGYNMPAVGSSGSGIYLGKQGPLIYNLTEINKSFVLLASVPKDTSFFCDTNLSTKSLKTKYVELDTPTLKTKFENQNKLEETYRLNLKTNKIKMKQDNFQIFTSELIKVPTNLYKYTNQDEFEISFTMERTLCQNTICCNFTVKVTSVFNRGIPTPARGDDFTHLYYRLAVFDGVKDYDSADTGGLQVCGVVPCASPDPLSCGLRADDSLAQPSTLHSYHQRRLTFNSITITGNFSNRDSFVGPNVLLRGDDDSFGKLLEPDGFTFSQMPTGDSNSVVTLEITKPINLVTASLYGRLFYRDGELHTRIANTEESYSFFRICLDLTMMIFAVAIIKYKIT